MRERVVHPHDPASGGAAGAGTTAETPLAVLVRGDVPPGDVEYAVRKVRGVLDRLGAPLLFGRVKLTHAPDPARARPAIVEVSLDIRGDVVRVHRSARDFREAADLLERRLRDRFDHRAERRDALRTRGPDSGPGAWRHGDPPTDRPEHIERPDDERLVERRKTFALDDLTPDEAAFDMEQLDYDFYLFRELATGEDAVLERLADGRYRLTRLHPTAVDVGPTAVPVVVADHEPPTLTLSDALARLHLGGEPFVFFADATTGRGHVVYTRYDGHDGVLVPAAPAVAGA